ncbi:MAG: hypothetical protein ACYTFI_28590, partial [Planctomycetota bacterium]
CSGEDEWCVINVRDDDDWAALVEALGRPVWAARRKYVGVDGRREAWREIARSVLGLSDPEIDRLVEEGVLEEAE